MIAVGLGLFVERGQVLLLRDGPGRLPGARAGQGENLQRAAERAVEEALGWRLHAQGLLALAVERLSGEGAEPSEQLVATFAFAAPAGVQTPAGAAWVPLADLAEAEVWPTDRLRIADALAAPPPPAPVLCRRAAAEVGPGGRLRVTFYG